MFVTKKKTNKSNEHFTLEDKAGGEEDQNTVNTVSNFCFTI